MLIRILERKQYLGFFIFFFILSAGFIFNSALLAQLTGETHVKTDIISEVKTIQPGNSFWVAVQLNMNAGWHTYWRNPGDSGLETTIEWELPEGFSAGEIQWPYPERIKEPPLTIFGYHNDIYLLTEISVDPNVRTGFEALIKAQVRWLECAEVCIPGEKKLELKLAVKTTPAEINEQVLETFAHARSKLPLKESDWILSAMIETGEIIIQATSPAWFKDELQALLFFPYSTDLINNSAEQLFQKAGNNYQLRVNLSTLEQQKPDSLKGILVTESGWRGAGSENALEIILPVSSGLNSQGVSAVGLTSLWLALLFSLLGGLILNLMPCVLPVLSIKIMSFINQANEEHSKSWQHGMIFTLGVLVSFWVLAGILLILKEGGAQLGWGFQLQSPVFLIILSAFLFLFGLSMFGVFEIGTSLTTVGGRAQGKTGFGGSFLSGVTATIVATPCTAPFMGSALGFAITQPAWVSMLVFSFIGLGMSAPYVLISSIPALLKFVPKPGRWMESLKQFMGFLLVATVIWLLWVLGLQAGSNVVILILMALLLSGIGAWIFGRWGNLAMPRKIRITASVLAALMILGSNVYALSNIEAWAIQPKNLKQSATGIEWKSYSEEAVADAKQSGHPLFIDFTAAWCLSCQVNEQIALSSEEVQQKFKELKVETFKADWTSRDEKITQALAKYGRNSVPLYILYSGRRNEEPKILPEIITPGIILEALESIR